MFLLFFYTRRIFYEMYSYKIDQAILCYKFLLKTEYKITYMLKIFQVKTKKSLVKLRYLGVRKLPSIIQGRRRS